MDVHRLTPIDISLKNVTRSGGCWSALEADSNNKYSKAVTSYKQPFQTLSFIIWEDQKLNCALVVKRFDNIYICLTVLRRYLHIFNGHFATAEVLREYWELFLENLPQKYYICVDASFLIQPKTHWTTNN